MGAYRQLNLPIRGSPKSRERLGEVPLGSPAEVVFRKILQWNRPIRTFYLLTYDLYVNSEDTLQAVGMRPIRRKELRRNTLLKFSDQTHRRVGAKRSPDCQNHYFGMAVASKVLVKGDEGDTVAHIPQLDFASRSRYQAILDPVSISERLKPQYPGYLLETGDSLHFWGINPLTQDGWRKFLRYATEVFTVDEIDPAFIEFSEQRGFSGLRAYSYGKVKPITPYVVAKVGGMSNAKRTG